MRRRDDTAARVKNLIRRFDGPVRMDLKLADILRISRSGADHKLSGRSRFSVSEVREVAEHYGAPVADILKAEARTPQTPSGTMVALLGEVAGDDKTFTTASGGIGRLILPERIEAYRVKGNGAYPLAAEGQVVLVDRSVPPKEGQYVVAESCGKTMLARYTVREGRVMLQFLNPAVPPLVVSKRDLRIYRVVGLLYP